MALIRLYAKGASPSQFALSRIAPDGCYGRTDTKYSTVIQTASSSAVWSDRHIGPGLLTAIGAFKSEVRKRMKDGLIRAVDWKPRYSVTSANLTRVKAMEVDLSSAYLSAALKIGACSEKTFHRINGYHKTSRLLIVGSLGTEKHDSLYVDGELVIQESWKEEALVQVWRWIVAEVDRVMNEIAKGVGGDFLHYWVDAAFVKRGAEQRVREIAAREGFGVKEKKVYVIGRPGSIRMGDGRIFPTLSRIDDCREGHRKGCVHERFGREIAI